MTRKFDQVGADIDDAADTVDELQAKPGQDIDTSDKLSELKQALEHASDALDDIDNDDDTDEKDR
jgi:hypothetical protein